MWPREWFVFPPCRDDPARREYDTVRRTEDLTRVSDNTP